MSDDQYDRYDRNNDFFPLGTVYPLNSRRLEVFRRHVRYSRTIPLDIFESSEKKRTKLWFLVKRKAFLSVITSLFLLPFFCACVCVWFLVLFLFCFFFCCIFWNTLSIKSLTCGKRRVSIFCCCCCYFIGFSFIVVAMIYRQGISRLNSRIEQRCSWSIIAPWIWFRISL